MPDVGEEREGVLENEPIELTARRTSGHSFISVCVQTGVAAAVIAALYYLESALDDAIFLVSLYLGVVGLWMCFVVASVRVARRTHVSPLDDVALGCMLSMCLLSLLTAINVTRSLGMTPRRGVLALLCSLSALIWLHMFDLLPAWARRGERRAHNQ